MQSVSKYHRRIDENPAHNILLIFKAAQYTEGLGHSEIPSSFPRLDAQDLWERMPAAQSGPKPCDTFMCAIYRLQTTRRFAPSLPAKFSAILECPVVFPVCAWAPPRSAPKPSDTFGLRFIASKRLAGSFRVCTKSFRPF